MYLDLLYMSYSRTGTINRIPSVPYVIVEHLLFLLNLVLVPVLNLVYGHVGFIKNDLITEKGVSREFL